MKKNFIKSLILLLLLVVSVKIVLAYSTASRTFGGKIINMKATEIQMLEYAGYKCNVDGASITIKSIKGPTTYVIPYSAISKTRGILAIGKWIIGKYNGKTTVTCTLEGTPPKTTIVNLDTITIFGTSL